MTTLHRLSCSALLCAGLFIPSFAAAQNGMLDLPPFSPPSVDSFFDINFDVTGLGDKCALCEVVRQNIDIVMAEVDGIETDLEILASLMDAAEQEMTDLDESITQAQAALEEFNNPQNYVESEGRRYDSSDNAAMQRRSAGLWDQYRAGKMTAQEYSDEVAKPFDDPAVQRELEKIKKQIKKEMEQKIKDMKGRMQDLTQKLSEWDQLGKDMTAERDELNKQLEELRAMLEECLKQCKEQDKIDFSGIGTQPILQGFFGGLFGGILDAINPPPVIPGLNDFLDQLTGGGPKIDVPTELREMNLEGPPVDSFFDIDLAPDIPPPACHLCDPVVEQINEFEDSLAQLEWNQNLLDLLEGLLFNQKAQVQQAKDQLQEDLDRLNNPPNYVESEGRRYDSTDHAAMQVRNSRLWADYKAGKLSAQQLSDEWAKPFDDPSVQRELDKITDRMKKELQDAIDDAQKEIDRLNQEISDTVDELVDIAGKIAAHDVILDHLYDELDECEKRCQEPSQDNALTEGFIETIDRALRDFEKSIDKLVQQSGKSEDDIIGRLTFDELVIPAGGSMDMAEIIRKSNEYDSTTGILTVGEKRYKVRDDGTLIPEDEWDTMDGELEGEIEVTPSSMSASSSSTESSEDSKKVGMGDEKENGFLCDWFGLFCPKPTVMVGDIADCFKDDTNAVCGKLWGPDEDDADMLLQPQFYLEGPGGTEFPLIINGMDGNDALGADDVIGLGNCLQNGPQDCGGLDFGVPTGNDRLFGDDFIGAGAGDFDLKIRGQGGDDVLIGDPLRDDLIGVGGGSTDILRGGPDDLLGEPGNDRLFGPGDDTLRGSPGGIGLDIIGQPGDDLLGDSGGSAGGPLPPPPPTTSEPNMQNDPQVRQVVQAAVQRYLQGNPLGPCEKLVVQVSRVRIGNRVRYTVRIRRVREESLCPAQCPPTTSYQSIGAPSPESCAAACQNGVGGCVVLETLPDGTSCILCGPPEFEESDEDDMDYGGGFELGDTPVSCTKDGGFNSMEACRSGCNNPSSCSYDGGSCWMCTEVPECDKDGGYNSMESCQRGCDGECGYDGGSCWLCTKKVECPDIAHVGRASCTANCRNGTCAEMPTHKGCFVCSPNDLPPASSSSQRSVEEVCDSPTMKKADCERSCDGDCERAYKTISGLECFECFDDQPKAACGDGTIDPGEECDRVGCDAGYFCTGDCTCVEAEETVPACPSGTTTSKSACESQCGSQGGVCINEDGCYSCVVVNCPSGTFKNECPSSCSSGCDVVGSQHGVNCYQCKQSCEDVCAQNGYGGPNTDHSDAILSELNGYSCVSGANISIQTATIGSCSCIGEYSLSVNQTPPVCSGTPCGDVACGSSATCADGDTQITVNCNWGGWEKIGKEQFRPKVGN